MITAKPSGVHRWVFDHYLNYLLKKHFHAVHCYGAIPDVDPDLPLLILPNHSTWWDGFYVYYLNAQFWRRPFYLMMLEEQLKKYSFFRRLGAFGIEQNNAKGILNSLRYSVGLLQQKDPPLICIFPQGELLPWGSRPLKYHSGIEWIVRQYQKPVNILQLGIATRFLGEKLPEVFFQFGKSFQFTAETMPTALQLRDCHEQLLDDLTMRIEFGEPGEISFSRNQQ